MSYEHITADDAMRKYRYDPETGLFYYADPQIKKYGQLINGANSHGYLHYRLIDRVVPGHRLAWLMFYGEWPKHHIDHLNGIRSDNRISNLRDVRHQTNTNNRRKESRSESGTLGVYASGRKWRATIAIDGKSTHIGTYETKDEAFSAYAAKKREIHPGFLL